MLTIIAVEHMDEVLREALHIENPETFLREPSRAVDWRVADRERTAQPAATTAALEPQPTGEPH